MKIKNIVLLLFITLVTGCASHRGSTKNVYQKKQTNPYERETKKRVEKIKPGVGLGEKPFLPELTPITSEGDGSVERIEGEGFSRQESDQRNESVTTKALSPAVSALVSDADMFLQSGDTELAASTLERALRIDSRNPVLMYKLATVRLQQSKPRQAEGLAKKAASLSANDRNIKRKAWLLISKARKLRNNYQGAKEAALKASQM
ncbi:MAG: hypothetical protein KAG19_01520 [Methylococcales bacterium]|nr:hypothetical protein [Methylococcales bacterium]